MRVGVNYPWMDYGWDFGLGPPAWRGTRKTPNWYDKIDAHLQRFRSLGITVVRWFILADGLTYGTGTAAPQPDPMKPDEWHFDPPVLSQEFRKHFEHLLQRFAQTSTSVENPVQLLPVLVDFHFCLEGKRPVEKANRANPIKAIVDPGWVKQGRADAILDASKRTHFLNNVLDKLLQLSVRHSGAIYAWELINEPDWITTGWHPNPLADTPVPESAMREFLEEGKTRIRNAGFKPTIGFGSMRTVQRSQITAELNQFHYYPGGTVPLPPDTFDPRYPGIIGEFATSMKDNWPDLSGSAQGVFHRLRLAEDRGYPLAIPWSFLAQDRATDWSPSVEQDIRSFTGCEIRKYALQGARARLEAVEAEIGAIRNVFPELFRPGRRAAGGGGGHLPGPFVALKPRARKRRAGMSAAQRQAVGERMRAHWAKRRSESGTAKTAARRHAAKKAKKRTMSPEARERIAAAQRKRWRQVRKAKAAKSAAG